MGFKHTLKKIMGQSVTDASGAAMQDKKQVLAAGNVHSATVSATEQKSIVAESAPDSSWMDENQTKESRQVGSKWEHKHDDRDWHSMSIPHPVPSKTQVGKEMPGEPAAPPRPPQPDTSSERKQDKDKSVSKQDILCKFVVQHGHRIGETISIDGGHLVFKHGAEKLYIPISSVSGFTDEDVQIGDFNRDEALRLGEEWHQRTTNSLKFDENGMLIND
jgi:hypothetical protein